MPFERSHHQRIEQVLYALDAPILRKHGCYFGGGTAIVLRFGEYRESLDVDFLASDITGFRGLRRLVSGPDGIQALFSANAGPVRQIRDIRSDQYGIRTVLGLAGREIKFEIVFEARFDLDEPTPDDEICGVAALSLVDMATSKMVANSDRWAEDGAFSRDLIDLAMIELSGGAWQRALAKAQAAYGDDVVRHLRLAIERLRERREWMDRCMDKLAIGLPKALVWERVRGLERRLPW